jgi:PAS domain S-box-containing protein
MTMSQLDTGSPGERSARPAHPARPLGHGAGAARHTVRFYERDDALVDAVSDYVAAGVAAGHPALLLATAPHRTAIAPALAARAVDVEGLRARGDLVLLDARQTLDAIMVGALPDEARFRETIGAQLRALHERRPGVAVRAYGEMVDVLWEEGNVEGALRVEALWNELAASYDFTLLCSYALARFADAAQVDAFTRVCDAHDRVTPTEAYEPTDEAARAREVARLQQRAAALEAEMARREALEARLRGELEALARAESALRASERGLQEFLETAAEGIHFVAADGTILWANRAELDLVGCTREEYIGRPITEFHADAATIADILARLRRGETLHNYEARMRRRDGAIRHVMINSNGLWRDGRLQHTRCFTRDVTELKAAAAEREALLERAEAMRREAEAASRAKTDFLAMMSHELRTPLNAIAGHAQLLQLEIHGPLTDAQREALARVQRSQHHLLALVNDVLNLARVESGRVEYAAEPIALAPLLDEMCEMVEPLLAAKALACEVTPAADAPTVRGDREKVQQIVLNLLTNAIKFTAAGGRVGLEAFRSDDGAAGGVRVSDTGIGIPAHRLESVFEPFVQVDAARYAPREGVGLGLAISRNLARGMGGDLTVESEVGVGSRFTLRLPLA